MERVIMKFKIIGLSILLSVLFSGVGHAGEDRGLYSRAMKSAKQGDADFAFMNYRSILREYPQSKFKEQALFAHAEYSFLLKHYDESVALFTTFVQDYPDSKGKLFALAYLLKIAGEKGDQKEVEAIRKQIISLRKISLVFRNFKKYKYRSPFYRYWKAIIYIDKIEFYINGELFEKIFY